MDLSWVDTQRFSERLVGVGLSPEQAKEVAKCLWEVGACSSHNLVQRADLAELRGWFDGRLTRLDRSVAGAFDGTRSVVSDSEAALTLLRRQVKHQVRLSQFLLAGVLLQLFLSVSIIVCAVRMLP